MSADDTIIIFCFNNEKKYHVARVYAAEDLDGQYRSEKLKLIFGKQDVKFCRSFKKATEIAFRMNKKMPAEYNINVKNV